MVLMPAAVTGMIATSSVRLTSWWAGTAVLLLLLALIPVAWARHGWRHLRVLHGTTPTQH
ncbi:hypothetical protein ACH9EU_05825 [Kocuria sp. M1R5S2]|uniref:hypothetical protein n=1 Tax=Kocuria rhizosphaerae TaxID=3376285 RepID=UPI003790CE54